MNYKDQHGYSLLSVMISIPIIAGLSLSMLKSSILALALEKPIVIAADLQDLKHLITERFSCEETLKNGICDGNETIDIATYTNIGEELTSSSGSNFHIFEVKATCSNRQIDFFYKTPLADEWEHLFDDIPVACFDVGICDSADLVSFEELPNGDPVTENMKIKNQFVDSHGISFSRKNGKAVRIGQVETDGSKASWVCHDACGTPDGLKNGLADDPDSNIPIGEFFLTDSLGLHKRSDLVVEYSTPVRRASAIFLDPDGGEEWTIKAYDENGKLISNQYFRHDNRDLDGQVYHWNIKDLPAGVLIKKIVMEGYKEKGGFGLGFDNFSPSKICDTLD